MAVTVFANLGAEEGPRWRQAIAHPAAQTLAASFTSLVADQAFSWLPTGEGLYPWLATDEAQAEADALGLPRLGPSVAAVARVHDKAFAHRACPGDDPASQAMLVLEPADLTDAGVLHERLAAHLATHPTWYRCGLVLKPRWGTSGRGRLSWSPSRGTSLEGVLGTRALEKLSARRGAVLEPWLTRRQDFSIQLHVPERGDPEVLAITRQDLRPAGVYLGNHGVIAPDGRASAGDRDDRRLLPGAMAAARAAQQAGFVGPCGVDAFTYQGPDGDEHLRAVVEINARATGGTVLAARLKTAVEEGRAQPGDRFRYEAGTDTLSTLQA